MDHKWDIIFSMGLNHLLQNTYTIKTGTKQVLQEVIIMNPSEIMVLFEDHAQLWDLDLNKLIYTSKTDPRIFFWTVPVPTGPTSIAFVHLENCEPCLSIYDIATDNYTKLADFDKSIQENYTKVIYQDKTKSYQVVSKGKDCRLYTFSNGSLTNRTISESIVFDKYNSSGASVTFSLNNKSNVFEIQRDDITSKYEFTGVEEGVISLVKEYSATEAVIGVVHNQTTSTAVLFSLNQQTNARVEKIPFPIDNILKVGDNWMAICTTQENVSSLQVQALFGDKEVESKVDKRLINKWFRIWNDDMPIMTLDHTEETAQSEIARFEIVRSASKRSVYTHLMEKTGILEVFGDEIVNAVNQMLS